MNTEDNLDLVLVGESETEALGERIGQQAYAGLLLDLRGDLGSGKTTFVRGLAKGMGLESMVRSPTFVIATLHTGGLPLLHVDAYRLDQQEEMALHGWNEWLEAGVIAAEWAGRIEGILPQRRLQLQFETVDEGHRAVKLKALGDLAGNSDPLIKCLEVASNR